MTTANKITLFRILLVPFFIVQLLYYRSSGNESHRFYALLCFALAAISDGVDGYIARRYNQRSELGAVLDPLADKVLLVSAVILLSLNNYPYLDRLPVWLAVTIISRDTLLLIGLGVIHLLGLKTVIRPHWIGKFATVAQMAVVLWILLKWGQPGASFCEFLAGAGTIFSGLIYLRSWFRQMSTSPASSPAQPD